MRSHTKSEHSMAITEYKAKFNQFFLDMVEKIFHGCGICGLPILLDSDTVASHLSSNKPTHQMSHADYNKKFMNLMTRPKAQPSRTPVQSRPGPPAVMVGQAVRTGTKLSVEDSLVPLDITLESILDLEEQINYTLEGFELEGNAINEGLNLHPYCFEESAAAAAAFFLNETNDNLMNKCDEPMDINDVLQIVATMANEDKNRKCVENFQTYPQLKRAPKTDIGDDTDDMRSKSYPKATYKRNARGKPDSAYRPKSKLSPTKFCCDVSKCKKIFKVESALNYHKFREHPECAKCQYRSPQTKDLEVHRC
jgi:hypothetical protein